MQTFFERTTGASDSWQPHWLLSYNRNAQSSQVIVYGLVLILITIYSFKLIALPMEQAANTFIHNINLPIHETGHLVFMPFGDFLHFLGGTLGQILMPLLIMLAFLVKYRDSFSAAMMFWWVGENFIDIAPYINDARTRRLFLVGGGRHDWAWLLGRLNMLQYDHTIAIASYTLGIILMITALLWAIVVLIQQIRWRQMRKHTMMNA